MEYSTTDTASVEAMLARLEDDHARFTELLGALQSNAAMLPGGERAARLDAGERAALDAATVRGLAASLRAYAGGGHHRMEETLFDALVERGVDLEVEGAILGLRDDHEQLDARAATVIDGLEQLLSRGSPPAGLPARLVDFCQYERYHMRMEHEHVFPAIRERLAGARWEAVARRLGAQPRG